MQVVRQKISFDVSNTYIIQIDTGITRGRVLNGEL